MPARIINRAVQWDEPRIMYCDRIDYFQNDFYYYYYDDDIPNNTYYYGPGVKIAYVCINIFYSNIKYKRLA